MNSTTNPALSRDALYAKSQVYIRRGLRAQAGNETEEYQLWASLALELLGKSALAKVHPALVADPTHYQSLFAACDRQLSPDIKTITAKTLFERLSHLEKSFDSRHQKFCEQMALRRNAELHSGESPFSGLAPETWEREYWGAVDAILRMQDESLNSWLGVENMDTPAKIIADAEEALIWSVKHRIHRCHEDFLSAHRDPSRRAAIIENSKNRLLGDFPRVFQQYDSHNRTACPACTSSGYLGGSFWHEEVSVEEDGSAFQDEDGEWHNEVPTERIDRTYTAEEFICAECSLRLYGAKEIAACELPNEFEETEVREREFGEDYGND